MYRYIPVSLTKNSRLVLYEYHLTVLADRHRYIAVPLTKNSRLVLYEYHLTVLADRHRYIPVPLTKNSRLVLYEYHLTEQTDNNFALDNMHHSHLIEFAKAIKNAKNPDAKDALMEALAAEVWEERDWGDAEYKYVVPRIKASKKKKHPELRKQRSSPKLGKAKKTG